MTHKIHANGIHAKLIHTREERKQATEKHLHYSVKRAIDIFEDCAMSKCRQKFLYKVVEEQNLNPGEMIYLDLISQNEPSYGGPNN